MAERLHIDPIDWYRAPDTAAFLREAAQGVWRHQRLRVEYTSWRGRSRRELEPLGLVLKAGAWYLVAREAGKADARTYRLASMNAMEVTAQSFRRPRAFDLARYWREAAARFEAGLRPLAAQVLASPRALGWLAQTRSAFQPLPGLPAGVAAPPGWRHITMPIESIEQGARQMLGYGDELLVVAPPALREEVRRLAAAVAARHAAPAAGG